MRPLLLALLMLPAAMLLAACAPSVSTRPAPSGGAAATPVADAPDMSGEWYLVAKDGEFPEIWTIKQVGNAVTGTIVYDPAAIPKGFANAPRDLYGTLIPSGAGWISVLQSPDGTFEVRADGQFTFCSKATRSCRLGAPRLPR
jgi:hypothetical protein